MKNHLPEVPRTKSDLPAINAYRSLGMMVMLDIIHRQSESRQDIKDYHSERRDRLQSRTALVLIGDERKPIGYVLWELVPRLKCQTAPFDNVQEVQEIFHRHLAEPEARSHG